jgi:hypothetical protein
MPFVKDSPKPPPEKKTAAAKTPPVPELLKKRTEAVEGGFQIAAMIATAVGLHADAAAASMHAEAISPEVAKLADDHAGVAKGIDFIMENGPYAALLTACLPFGMQIAVNHGWIKAERLPGSGVVNPGVLEARFKLGMMEKASAMLREQKALEERLIIAQMEFQAELNDAIERNSATNTEDTPAE